MALNTLPNEGLTNRGYPSDRIVTPLIINGDMSVAQRTTSTSSVSSGATYIVDRFFVSPSSAGTWTMSQSTTTPTGQGFGKSFKMDCTSATTSLGAAANLIFQQRIEGQNLQTLKKGTSSAEAVTFSFWVRSNKTGTYTLEMYDNDNTRQISKTYTISSADTWEKKTVNFAGDTTGAFDNDNASSLTILFWLGAGSNFTSGTFSESWSSATTANRVSSSQVNLADSTSNEWYITGLQMEVGEFDSTSIPSFPFESFENNLSKCQRYYQLAKIWWGGDATNGEEYRAGTQLTTEMRATPSVTYTHEDSANFSTSATSQGATSYNLAIRVAAAASANARYYVFAAKADSELD